MPKYIGIIPARYASTRFPGKPLADIKGKSMIQRVYEQVLKAELNAVYVATDHEQIYNHVTSFGGSCLLTSDKHQSGTDRINECASILNLKDETVVINIQGDEPFIQASQIKILCELFENPQTNIATLIKIIESKEELEKNTIPKVVVNTQMQAIYFSRSIIPYPAKKSIEELISEKTFFKHIGIYAYRVSTLKKIAVLPPSMLEQAESLEQLRWIENGFNIQTAITQDETIAVDTVEDLKKAIDFLEQKKL